MQNISATDFYKKTKFNAETQTQIWMSEIADGHDNFCCCNWPFAHLLASIFPPGHKDRDLTINDILKRDYRELCLSGGEEGESRGSAAGGTGGGFKQIKEDAEEDYPEEELDAILAEAIKEGAR